MGLKLLYDQLSLNERHPGFLLPYWALDAAVHEKYLSLRRKRVHERLLSACPLAHLRRQFRLLRHVLAEDRSLRIIHIRRRNIVRAHLSVVVATRFSWVNSPRAEGPIRLELDALRQAIAQTRLYEAMFRRLFRDHPYREVFYEDLLADLTYELEQLVRFLKLPAGGLAAMPASEQRPLDNEVANLQELRSALRWRDLDALLMTV